MESGVLTYLAPVTDAAIVVLLVATIAYAAILDRKLSALRDGKQEMERLVGGLTAALAQAENGLAELKGAAEHTGRNLQQAIGKGNSLADDLVFLIDRAGNLADRMERLAKERRREERGASRADASPAVDSGGGATRKVDRTRPRRNRTPEQAALLEALRGVR